MRLGDWQGARCKKNTLQRDYSEQLHLELVKRLEICVEHQWIQTRVPPKFRESLVFLAVVLVDYLFGWGTVQLHFWNWVVLALVATLKCVSNAEKCVRRNRHVLIEGLTLRYTDRKYQYHELGWALLTVIIVHLQSIDHTASCHAVLYVCWFRGFTSAKKKQISTLNQHVSNPGAPRHCIQALILPSDRCCFNIFLSG